MSIIVDLDAVTDRYRGFIVDLWGVVHNGIHALPGARDALLRMRADGACVCLLSNSPRPVTTVADLLRAMGIGQDCYDHLMTSGEAICDAFARSSPELELGRRCLHLGPPGGFGLLDRIDRLMVDEVGRADFVLATGFDPDRTRAWHGRHLRRCAERRLPMICANPDLVVAVGGRTVLCAGTLARDFEALGGHVHYFGKPHAAVYRHCLERMALERQAVLAIGDGMHTDIAGAIGFGIDAALVAGGIHRAELGMAWGEPPSPERLEAMLARWPCRPTYVIPALGGSGAEIGLRTARRPQDPEG